MHLEYIQFRLISPHKKIIFLIMFFFIMFVFLTVFTTIKNMKYFHCMCVYKWEGELVSVCV